MGSLFCALEFNGGSLLLKIAISYGYGAVKWGRGPYNAIRVPAALYSLEDDPSQ